MASKYFSIVLILFLSRNVDSASLIERSYEYVMNLGKSLAPSFMNIMECFGENDPWECAREKAGKILENWDAEVDKQRSMWQDAADAEVSSSGRSIEELPSKLGKDVEQSLFSLADLVKNGMERAFSRKHHDDGGGIDSITISTGGGDKKKMKKKKQKPPKIHLVHPMMMQQMKAQHRDDRAFSGVQSWVIGEGKNLPARNDQENATNEARKGETIGDVVRKGREIESALNDQENETNDARMGHEIEEGMVRKGRGIMSDLWAMGENAVDAMAEHAVENDNIENGVQDKSSLEEQRGKKKKKKKAILKLLILGAVLKAKIGTLLQILSFKLQVKFFLIALIGLGINLARFWLDLKKSHHHQPQKVIYVEHAQHQHHYEHEEEPAWGPWSRSMDPPEEVETEIDVDFHNSPYRAQIDRNARPILTRVQ